MSKPIKIDKLKKKDEDSFNSCYPGLEVYCRTIMVIYRQASDQNKKLIRQHNPLFNKILKLVGMV